MHANDVAGTVAIESEGAVDGNEAFLNVVYDCLIKEVYDIKVKSDDVTFKEAIEASKTPAVDPITQRLDKIEMLIAQLADTIINTNRNLAKTDGIVEVLFNAAIKEQPKKTPLLVNCETITELRELQRWCRVNSPEFYDLQVRIQSLENANKAILQKTMTEATNTETKLHGGTPATPESIHEIFNRSDKKP